MAEEYRGAIAKIQSQLDLVGEQVAYVEQQVQQVEEQLASTPVDDAATLAYLRKKKEQLCTEKEQLRTKKEQLRKKKELLLEALVLKEKSVLLERQSSALCMLTARGYSQQQLPQMKQPVSDQASSSHTNTRHKRTFADLLPWEGFTEAVDNFVEGLDDAVACYKPLVFERTTTISGGTQVFDWTPADKAEVRGVVFRCSQGVTEVASSLGMDVEYTGGGSGRCLSSTDLVLRVHGTTDRDAVSSLILGVVQVKGKWQMNLSGSDNLLEALLDEDKGKDAVHVTQQAYGDAVMDEAPLLIVTNYEVTYFIHRNVDDVTDERLWVSPPVGWSSQSPRPLAAWMFCLSHAAQLGKGGVKKRLPCLQVPSTHHIGAEMCIFSRIGWDQAPQRQQPTRGQPSSGHHHQQQAQHDLQHEGTQLMDDVCMASRLQGELVDADCGVRCQGTGTELPGRGCSSSISESSSSSSHSSLQGDLQAWESLRQAGPAKAVAALPTLYGSSLLYSDCVLSLTSSFTVVKGTVLGRPAAVKMYTLEEDAIARFTQEVSVYLAMQHLQLSCLVPLLAVGLVPHSGRPVIALAEGHPLPKQLPAHLHAQAREALLELHQAGWVHGHVRSRNMVLYSQRVVFCDLGTCKRATELDTKQELYIKQDLDDLEAMLYC